MVPIIQMFVGLKTKGKTFGVKKKETHSRTYGPREKKIIKIRYHSWQGAPNSRTQSPCFKPFKRRHLIILCTKFSTCPYESQKYFSLKKRKAAQGPFQYDVISISTILLPVYHHPPYPALRLRLPQQNRCGCGCGRTPNRNEFSIFLKFMLKTYKP